MNALSLTISHTPIRQDSEGRYCLSDLFKAAGSHKRHRPNYWLQNQQTQDLIAKLTSTVNPSLEQNQPLKVINGGNNRGTYVVKELVYAYAMWVSAELHIAVIRAYDALVTGQVPRVARQANLFLEDENLALHQENAELKAEVLNLYRKLTPVPDINTPKVPVEAVVLMERYGVPRAYIARVSGRNMNCIRQHIHNAKKAGV